MGRPREHGEERRGALLEAAAEILREQGVSGLSLRRLAAATGTSTRAIYSLFGDKQGLLSAIYQDLADTLAAHHAAVVSREDAVDELVALSLAFRSAARAHPTLYPFVLSGLPGFSPSVKQVEVAREGYLRVVAVFERGLADGTFDGGTAPELAIRLRALVHGLADLELAGLLGGPRKAEGHWRAAVSAMLRGFSVV